ncbi:MAG TPA: zinc-ribbon domain-containing protein [Chloroflexota bacterium]|jgi:hypothetical protein|nr:zinc-ribbon domain-containing protein [Chloroflexota bacterium]
MDTAVPFTSRYDDLSTDTGHQFQFYCERCGNGYSSTFKTSTVANIGSKATQSLGGMFGGRLSKVAGQADAALHNVTDTKMKERAFAAAVDEVGSQFHRCNQCRDWVCEEKCWDTEYNLCTNCAAPLRAAGTAPTPAVPPEEVVRSVAEAVAGVVGSAKLASKCTNCSADLAAGAKFCPECGTPVAVASKCASCGAELAAGTRFCSECGAATATA